MNTLPSARSVNTFQNREDQSSGEPNMRTIRAASLYFPKGEQEDESRNLLFPPTTDPPERRTQTLGRTHHIKNDQSNMRNPLFDSVGSLEQPWLRTYAHTISLSPPQISVPVGGFGENATFATARDLQPMIRVPPPRSVGRTSPYSFSGRPASVREPFEAHATPVTCMGCLKSACCERDQNPYSIPEYHDTGEDRRHSDERTSKPWLVCLITVTIVFDILLLIILTVVVFFLNCSWDGWLYSDRRIHSMCTTLWSDWIPLHHRQFRCPALPHGLDSSGLDITDPALKQYMQQFRPGTVTLPTNRGDSGGIRRNHIRPFTEPTAGTFPNPEIWDADLGLMPPPDLKPATIDSMYGMTTTRLYGPSYEDERVRWMGGRDHWLKLNPLAPYRQVKTDSIIIGCALIPLVTIAVIEVAAFCISCCYRPNEIRKRTRFGKILNVIGRLYRIIVTYIFGLLTVILIVLILKASIGRLRPNFIIVCQPSSTVCPQWAALLQARGYQYVLDDGRADYSTNPQLLSFLAQESARQGFYLVPRTTTQNPNTMGAKAESGYFSDTHCSEKRVLRLKYARTSFPSLGSSVTMYATVFLSAYITHTLRYLRRTCFCVPLSLLVGGCLTNVCLGLGRVVHRENWLEDILAGWVLGIIVSVYVLYRALHNIKNTKDISNRDLQRQLRQLQNSMQNNHDYRQNEIKLMKYM